MCGICGKYNFGSNAPVPDALITAMRDTLVHRGPDGAGNFVDGAIGLGHRRLKIIDLHTGAQPMQTADGRLTVVFNGEIYNFHELRLALEREGRKFRTRSDTEVLLHGYAVWGTGLLTKLRGMFAFALWDAEQRQLLLARDRLGIKPLYWSSHAGSFWFGSELKAILADPAVARIPEPEAIADFFTYMYIPAPRTIFKKIHKLPAGHFLRVTANGVRQEQYWDLAFSENGTGREQDYHAELMQRLRKSVKLRMISDVPLGAFLSGGIDSSAVVGLMSKMSDARITTASIGFEDAAFDELPWARMVAKRYATQAHEKIVDADAAAILDTLAWHYDEPFADPSMVPTYYVSQAARQWVTVCLSGDGGDENFAGYRRYKFDVFENRIRALLPGAVSQRMFSLLAAAYPKADWLPRPLRAKTLLTNLSLSPERGYFNSMSAMPAAMRRELLSPLGLNGYDPFAMMAPHFEKSRGWHPLARIQYVDFKTYLTEDILTKVDRASMAHSLEVRVPILDHEVIEYAATIPAKLKLRSGEGKYIFKRSLQDIVPKEILYREKQGFVMPVGNWLRGELKPLFESTVLADDARLQAWCEPNVIASWWQQHQRKTRDLTFPLWALLMLESWARRHLPA